MGIIKLIRRIEHVSSETISKYNHIVIFAPLHNFERLNKIRKELEVLLSQGKEYSVTKKRTEN